MLTRIPFNKPSFLGNEERYMREAIANGHISGDGPFTKACHKALEDLLGAPKALLTTSCTHALEMSALLLDIEPGDEILMPSFTFVSTANAFALYGARLVFVDIRPDTLNIDETQLERHITAKTKAIVVVHYAGVGCDMDAICDVARRYRLTVIEDNAHGFLGRYKGQNLGTFGAVATQSFHETKNFTCGEGGALIINAHNLIEAAEIIREKGTNRSRFFRGQVDKYTWVSKGSSYLPSDLLAAFLFAQLETRETIQNNRKTIWERYAIELTEWASVNGVRLPHIPSECDQPYHMFYLLMPSLEERTRFIQFLSERGVTAVFHYVPLHSSQMGLTCGTAQALPVTDRVSETLVRLPFYNTLTIDEQARIIEAVQSFKSAAIAV